MLKWFYELFSAHSNICTVRVIDVLCFEVPTVNDTDATPNQSGLEIVYSPILHIR